jgi:uncharacterized protein (DUF2147 family)
MRSKAQKFASIALGFTLILAGAAQASPVGMWEIEMGDSRYDVTLCGDGTQLCARLIWLGNGADNEQNMPYLNTLLIDKAVRVSEGEWKGDLHLFGQTAAGTIKQVSDDHISLRGCVAYILCKDYQMYRIQP